MDLLKTLIISSEKAANIARLLRQNEKLFQKLVEQKSSEEANPRFREDFKTLADVLIQEMVKYDISLKFPSLRDRVQGEENNHFYSNELNKELIVEVKSTEEETASLLSEFLDDDKSIAKILAAEVHRQIDLDYINTKIPEEDIIVDLERLGIWIDPIDGTNEYVKGGCEEKNGNFYSKGLKCVTVLIGVHDEYGQPLMGVINQPFFDKRNDDGYQCYWGICIQQGHSLKRLSLVNELRWKETNIICIGGSEDEQVIEALRNGGYNLIVSRGAGYKLLTVVLGYADAYILSKPSTFFWDTCGPQAVLRALGGNIVQMRDLVTKKKNYVTYLTGDDHSTCNINGIVAYRNEKTLNRLIDIDWKS